MVIFFINFLSLFIFVFKTKKTLKKLEKDFIKETKKSFTTTI